MRKGLVIGLVVAAIAIAVWFWSQRVEGGAGKAVSRGSGASTERPTTRGEQAERPAPPSRVRRLDPEERRRLGEQITAARARAKAQGGAAGGPAATADDTIALEQVSTTVQAALQEAIPILAECYTQRAGDAGAPRAAAVQMTMTSDPDLGTVIDTDAMTDADGNALELKLDDCLRTAIESFGLPPLEVGGRLTIKYSFVFD